MTLPDALADDLTSVLRIAGLALNRSDGFRGGGVDTPLLGGVVILFTVVLKPLLRGKIQSGRERDLAAPSFALKTSLQLRGDTPAVHFGLHALHCSATGPSVVVASHRPFRMVQASAATDFIDTRILLELRTRSQVCRRALLGSLEQLRHSNEEAA